MATSNRVRKAAPLRQRFSLDVSSSKMTPRLSRPRTRRGKRTAILRSERCCDTGVLTETMRWVRTSGYRRAGNISGDRRAVDEAALNAFEALTRRTRGMRNSAKLAAVPHAMSKPACELLHFAYTIGQVGSINLPIVVHEQTLSLLFGGL